MNITITKFVTGPLETNSYVVSMGKLPVLVIDPSSNCGELLHSLKSERKGVEAIVLTHGHFDHMLGIPEILAYAPAAPVWVNPNEKPMVVNAEFNGSFMLGKAFSHTSPTRDLPEGPLSIGPYSFDVAYMPGHTPGGAAFIFRDSNETACISGDSLFAGSIGRSDFPGSDGKALLRCIRDNLLTLPDNAVVYPGHGGRTTIGRERRLNPFLQFDS